MVSSPKIPAAPDPVATANAQGQVNRETAITNATMSHVNQSNPYGSQNWALDTSTAGGKAWQDYYNNYANWQADSNPDKGGAPSMPDKGIDPQWKLTTTLDPNQQKMLDSTNAISQRALDIGNTQLDRVSSSLSNPLSTDGLPARVTAVDGPKLASGIPNADYINNISGIVKPTSGSIDYSVDPTKTAITDSIGSTAGSISYSNGVTPTTIAGGPIQSSVNFGNLAALPGSANDFDAATRRASDAVYNQATSRLDPQYDQQKKELEARLADQGLTVGSEAWNAQMDAYNRAKTDAYNQANYSAINTGNALQQALYNQALSTRQQGVNEALSSGNFANAAQAQAYGQALSGRQQYVNEAQQNWQNNNTAQAQDFGQQQARSQFQNAAQAQEYAQNLSNTQLNNAAQAQEYGQNLSSLQTQNAAKQQWFNETLANTQLGNAAAQQDYSNRLANANFANSQRDAALNEASTLRSAPLSELRGLMGMSSYQAPTFGQVNTPQMAAPDLMGATYQSYNGQLQAAQMAQQAQSGMFGSIAGLLGSGLSAYAMNPAMFSDRRLKTGIVRLTETFAGLPLYLYRYVWGGPIRLGVMAQDVADAFPALVRRVNGFLAVDYAALSSAHHAQA